jgi:putative transposase
MAARKSPVKTGSQVLDQHRHLVRALREFEQFYNGHRPHRGIANARPLRALPQAMPSADADTRLRIRRRDRLDGILHEYQHAA